MRLLKTTMKVENHVVKGEKKSKLFFQVDVSTKKQMNEFDFTTMKPQVDLFSFVFWRKLRHFEFTYLIFRRVILR